MSINQLFDQFIGTNQANAGQTQQSQHNVNSLADKIPGGMVGGLAAGGLLGVLVGNKKVRKKAGKMAGTAVGIGGAAVLGAVAYNAYKNWQGGNNALTPQEGHATVNSPANTQHVPIADQSNFDPTTSTTRDGDAFQIALIKAMIAAANADGHIDREEQKAVFDAVNRMQLEAEDKALIFDLLQNPSSIHEVAALSTSIEQASEIYLVSRMAIDPDHPSEKAYLADLVTLLKLPEGLVDHLDGQVEEAEMEAA